jgi:hypothetical protein
MGGLSSVTEEADPPMSTVSQDRAEKGLLAGRTPFTQVPRKEMFSEVSSTLQCKTTQLGMRPTARNVIIVAQDDWWGNTMGSL